jgi:hypothetical protein
MFEIGVTLVALLVVRIQISQPVFDIVPPHKLSARLAAMTSLYLDRLNKLVLTGVWFCCLGAMIAPQATKDIRKVSL